MRRAAGAVAALLLGGCAVRDGLPAARLELVTQASKTGAQGGLHFRFARGRTGGVVQHGQEVTFTFGPQVRRVAFNQRRQVPEAWALRWQNAETKAIHSVVVLVLERGNDPTIELIRPYGKRGPPFEWVPETNYPELGRQIGVFAGPKIKLRLDGDGGVTPIQAARGARPKALVPKPTRH